MTVLGIVPNLKTDDPQGLAQFYTDILGLEVQHDMGWITFLRGQASSTDRLQLAQEGGSGTDVPVLSIEVDDLDAVLARAEAAGHSPVYGPVVEPWGVRRFYLRDPAGHLVNILTHQ